MEEIYEEIHYICPILFSMRLYPFLYVYIKIIDNTVEFSPNKNLDLPINSLCIVLENYGIIISSTLRANFQKLSF